MNKTAIRIALEGALRAAPHGKVQQFIRRAVGRNHGYQRAPRRSVRLPQVWSSKHAAKEFFGQREDS